MTKKINKPVVNAKNSIKTVPAKNLIPGSDGNLYFIDENGEPQLYLLVINPKVEETPKTEVKTEIEEIKDNGVIIPKPGFIQDSKSGIVIGSDDKPYMLVNGFYEPIK